jgi:hypothetical protein
MPRSTIPISSLITAQIAAGAFPSAGISLDTFTLGICSKHHKDTSALSTDANIISWEPEGGLIGKTTRRDTSKDDILGLRPHLYCRSTDNDEVEGRREY